MAQPFRTLLYDDRYRPEILERIPKGGMRLMVVHRRKEEHGATKVGIVIEARDMDAPRIDSRRKS